MMPEIRNTNSACRTAPAKIHAEEQDRSAARSAGSSAGRAAPGFGRGGGAGSGAGLRCLLIGQCVLLELPRHPEAHAVPSTRMAATAQGRPLPARRPGSRRAQRARIRRRRLGLALALLAAAAIGLSTTFASGTTAPAESRPLSDRGRARRRAGPADAGHARLAAAHGADRPARDHGRRLPPLRRAPTRSRSRPSATRATPAC